MDNRFIKVFNNFESSNLIGKVLVATPSLNESIFERSLIFICAHDVEGTIGVIVNKPYSVITSKEILDKFSIKKQSKVNRKYTIHTGGPIDEDKLFILSFGSSDKNNDSEDSQLTLYTNADAFLLDSILGKNNNKFIACNGFCGWEQHQLENEINENSWIVTDMDFKAIFTGQAAKKWAKIIKQLGIKNPNRLVPYSGNA